MSNLIPGNLWYRVQLPIKDSRKFKAECSQKGITMAEVIRRLAVKVGSGDSALLDRVVKQ